MVGPPGRKCCQVAGARRLYPRRPRRAARASLFFISGQVAITPNGSIHKEAEVQLAQAFTNLRNVLAGPEITPASVVKAILTDRPDSACRSPPAAPSDRCGSPGK
jgi:hypothetical protein